MTPVVLALAIVASSAPLQDPASEPGPQNAAPAAQEQATPAKVPVPAPVPAIDRAAFRDNMSNMESLLATAVSNGARKLLIDNPGLTLVPNGPARARGFALEGYGLFFDVEIPEMNGSIEMTLLLQREMRRLEEQTQGPRRTAGQQTLSSIAETDPSAPYREAVIISVIGTMLDYSKNLNVQPNEFMAVGLRGSDVPQQMGFRDSRTVILRVRGTDLADFLANRISRDEAIKRVDKREF
jgi:hypothetical protein